MALRVGCKIVCSHFENEFCAMTFPKNYHRSALRCAYNCKQTSFIQDVETNPYSKKFTESYKSCRKGLIASPLAARSKIPTNNFTVNRSFSKIFGLEGQEQEMTTSLRIRKMSTLQSLANLGSDDEADQSLQHENEFARTLYNRFRLPQLRDERALNQIAFSRKHIIETPKLPKYFHTEMVTGNVSTFKKLPTVKTSPRGLRHQFNLPAEGLPEQSFFSGSDLLDPVELKKMVLQRQSATTKSIPKQTSYRAAEAYSNRRWQTTSVRSNAYQQRSQPNIFSKTGYSSGDIWKKRRYATRFVADSESLKLNLLNQTKHMQPNLYHDMANVSKSPAEVTSRLSLLLNQNILQSSTRKLSSKAYVNGFLMTVPAKKHILGNMATEVKPSHPKEETVPGPGQLRIAGFIPMWQGRKGKTEIKTWCFKPKKQRKELSFLKQLLMSCYKRSA